MKIRHSWIVFTLIASPLVMNSQGIQQDLAESAAIRSQNEVFNKAENKAQILAHQRLLESKTALERVQAACVPVVDADTETEVRMVEKERVRQLNFPQRTLGDRTLICNSLGDTAEVWDGKIVHIASAAPQDLEEYLSFFERQRR